MSIIDPEGPRPVEHGGGQGEDRHGRAGYLRVFKHLRQNEIATVRHGMGTQPLVDVYELQSFSAAVSADETVEPGAVHFYLYHRSDATVRVRGPEGGLSTVTVDDPRDPSYRIPFTVALREAGLEAGGGERHLGDVVVEFWKAFFAPPSDPFDEESYANSRWLDRHVGDRRSLDELRTGGAWDDLWLMYRPRKTLNWPRPATLSPTLPAPGVPQPELPTGPVLDEVIRPPLVRQPFGAPPGVEVLQLGLDTVGLRLLSGGPPSVAVMALLRA